MYSYIHIYIYIFIFTVSINHHSRTPPRPEVTIKFIQKNIVTYCWWYSPMTFPRYFHGNIPMTPHEYLLVHQYKIDKIHSNPIITKARSFQQRSAVHSSNTFRIRGKAACWRLLQVIGHLGHLPEAPMYRSYVFYGIYGIDLNAIKPLNRDIDTVYFRKSTLFIFIPIFGVPH